MTHAYREVQVTAVVLGSTQRLLRMLQQKRRPTGATGGGGVGAKVKGAYTDARVCGFTKRILSHYAFAHPESRILLRLPFTAESTQRSFLV